MWLKILLAAIIIGGIIGYLSSDGKDKVANTASGAFLGGMGCGYILIQILLWGLGFFLIIWLFEKLFC